MENNKARMLRKHEAKRNLYKGNRGRGRVEEGPRWRKVRKYQVKDSTTDEIEAFMFLAGTPEEELVRLLQDGDNLAREGINKFVERGWETVRGKLCRNNP